MAIIGDSLASASIAEGSQSAAAAAKNEEDLNKFLNLLVTQLKNQDPLDPMDATEFTSQLVQFASVEQQIFANSNLEKLVNLEETSQVSTLVDFIGNTVEAEARTLPLENASATFTYEIPAGTAQATISITDSDGLTSYTGEGDPTSGQHTFKWDGKSTQGNQLPDGDYTVSVNALDASGNLMPVTYTIFGRVTGAGVDEGQSNLFMGDKISIPHDKIKSVKETKVTAP
ncbi:MAG: flagellar hook assembly protein FlgD [Pseudomonadota bacterium]|nr:flagellar hook assembly protein FlgD [Pseudomonadota bacterium]